MGTFLNGPKNVTALTISTVAAITALVDPSFVGFTITPTDGKVYWGASGVTTADGQPLESGQSVTIETRNPAAYYLVADSGTVAVRLTLFTGTRS